MRTFRIVEGLAAERSFDAAWDQLATASDCYRPFQSAWWCRSWSKVVAGKEGYVPMIAYAAVGGVEVACGFAVAQESGRPVARALGVGWIDYYDAVGARSEDSVSSAGFLLERAAREWSLRLEDVVDDGLLCRAARLIGAQIGRSTATYVVDLYDRERLLACTLRRSHAISERRLGRLGSLRYRNYSTAEAMRGQLREFIRLHKESWSGRAETFAPFGDGVADDMFREMVDNGATRGEVVISSLECNGQPMAMYFGLQSGYWYGSYRITYDRGVGRYSPGRLLLNRMLRERADNGYREFDFLRGDHSYKMEYEPDVRYNITVTC
jgi:CelD/BcsL family acetyltransferase involved in cellulose biosynthesis